jgi:secreted PhoX family phosphatase
MAAMTIGRRDLFKRGGALTGASLFSGLTLSQVLAACSDDAPGTATSPSTTAPPASGAGGYGALVENGDLFLPEGFRYVKFDTAGMTMSDGNRLPGAHDGTGLFVMSGGVVTLVRNQEMDPDGEPTYVPVSGTAPYDPAGNGGVTITRWDPAAEAVLEHFVALSGTIANCGGGVTPWGTWLSAEETTDELDRPHGYVFEVAADASGEADPAPITAMGRFTHEAAVVDPANGAVYLTEDNGEPGDGFYQYLPERSGSLGALAAGGRLRMLKIKGEDGFDTATGQAAGASYPCEWLEIDEADPTDAADSPEAVYAQGAERGAARFLGLEGAFFLDGSLVMSASDGGDAELGQIWRYTPDGVDGGTLDLLYESSDERVLFNPDAIVISPRGGILLCEDGDSEDSPDAPPGFLRVLTADGRIEDFCRPAVQLDLHAHNINGDAEDQQPEGALGYSEFSGPTFSPDGAWLFVHLQYPGATYAITGPWEHGAL